MTGDELLWVLANHATAVLDALVPVCEEGTSRGMRCHEPWPLQLASAELAGRARAAKVFMQSRNWLRWAAGQQWAARMQAACSCWCHVEELLTSHGLNPTRTPLPSTASPEDDATATASTGITETTEDEATASSSTGITETTQATIGESLEAWSTVEQDEVELTLEMVARPVVKAQRQGLCTGPLLRCLQQLGKSYSDGMSAEAFGALLLGAQGRFAGRPEAVAMLQGRCWLLPYAAGNFVDALAALDHMLPGLEALAFKAAECQAHCDRASILRSMARESTQPELRGQLLEKAGHSVQAALACHITCELDNFVKVSLWEALALLGDTRRRLLGEAGSPRMDTCFYEECITCAAPLGEEGWLHLTLSACRFYTQQAQNRKQELRKLWERILNSVTLAKEHSLEALSTRTHARAAMEVLRIYNQCSQLERHLGDRQACVEELRALAGSSSFPHRLQTEAKELLEKASQQC